MTVLSVDLPMTREGWANAREHFPCDACGVYVFCAEADRLVVPLRVGQAIRTLRQRLYASKGHRQAFLAGYGGDPDYTEEWPNYVSFFSQMRSLVEQRFLTNTTVSLLALPMDATEQIVTRAENEACRELDPVWEMKDAEGRKAWKKRQFLKREPRLEEFVERWVQRNGQRNPDIGSVLRQIEASLNCERAGS